MLLLGIGQCYGVYLARVGGVLLWRWGCFFFFLFIIIKCVLILIINIGEICCDALSNGGDGDLLESAGRFVVVDCVCCGDHLCCQIQLASQCGMSVVNALFCDDINNHALVSAKCAGGVVSFVVLVLCVVYGNDV